MSVDLLRRAAGRLREQATAAQHGQPWCPEYLWSAIRHVQRNCDELECGRHGEDRDGECGQPDMYDGRYVALMHPPVALALARWLDALAEIWDGQLDHEVWPDVPAALAVAGAILREPS